MQGAGRGAVMQSQHCLLQLSMNMTQYVNSQQHCHLQVEKCLEL